MALKILAFNDLFFSLQRTKQQDQKNWEMRLQAETDKRHREVQHLQDVASRNLSQAQSLQATLDSLQQQQQKQQVGQSSLW